MSSISKDPSAKYASPASFGEAFAKVASACRKDPGCIVASSASKFGGSESGYRRMEKYGVALFRDQETAAVQEARETLLNLEVENDDDYTSDRVIVGTSRVALDIDHQFRTHVSDAIYKKKGKGASRAVGPVDDSKVVPHGFVRYTEPEAEFSSMSMPTKGLFGLTFLAPCKLQVASLPLKMSKHVSRLSSDALDQLPGYVAENGDSHTFTISIEEPGAVLIGHVGTLFRFVSGTPEAPALAKVSVWRVLEKGKDYPDDGCYTHFAAHLLFYGGKPPESLSSYPGERRSFFAEVEGDTRADWARIKTDRETLSQCAPLCMLLFPGEHPSTNRYCSQEDKTGYEQKSDLFRQFVDSWFMLEFIAGEAMGLESADDPVTRKMVKYFPMFNQRTMETARTRGANVSLQLAKGTGKPRMASFQKEVQKIIDSHHKYGSNLDDNRARTEEALALINAYAELLNKAKETGKPLPEDKAGDWASAVDVLDTKATKKAVAAAKRAVSALRLVVHPAGSKNQRKRKPAASAPNAKKPPKKKAKKPATLGDVAAWAKTNLKPDMLAASNRIKQQLKDADLAEYERLEASVMGLVKTAFTALGENGAGGSEDVDLGSFFEEAQRFYDWTVYGKKPTVVPLPSSPPRGTYRRERCEDPECASVSRWLVPHDAMDGLIRDQLVDPEGSRCIPCNLSGTRIEVDTMGQAIENKVLTDKEWLKTKFTAANPEASYDETTAKKWAKQVYNVEVDAVNQHYDAICEMPNPGNALGAYRRTIETFVASVRALGQKYKDVFGLSHEDYGAEMDESYSDSHDDDDDEDGEEAGGKNGDDGGEDVLQAGDEPIVHVADQGDSEEDPICSDCKGLAHKITGHCLEGCGTGDQMEMSEEDQPEDDPEESQENGADYVAPSIQTGLLDLLIQQTPAGHPSLTHLRAARLLLNPELEQPQEDGALDWAAVCSYNDTLRVIARSNDKTDLENRMKEQYGYQENGGSGAMLQIVHSSTLK